MTIIPLETTEVSHVGLQTSYFDAANAAIRGAFDEIEKNWEAALAGGDVDALHDLRVGSRRLRAALSVYEAVLPKALYRRVEKRIADLTDALGAARDTDVLIEHLTAGVGKLVGARSADRAGVDYYIQTLAKQRGEQQAALKKAMALIDMKQLAHDMESALEAGALEAGALEAGAQVANTHGKSVSASDN